MDSLIFYYMKKFIKAVKIVPVLDRCVKAKTLSQSNCWIFISEVSYERSVK